MSRYAFRYVWLVAAAVPATVAVSACSLSDLVGNQPANVETETTLPQNAVESPEGARMLYYGLLELESRAVQQYVIYSGVLTDELRVSYSLTALPFTSYLAVDQRVENSGGGNAGLFTTLQGTRIMAAQTRPIVARFTSVLPPDWVARLYVSEGLMYILLAELYCSGIPLSQLDDPGGYILSEGIPTTEVFKRAIALLDSAIQVPDIEPNTRYSAAVLKARALLNLHEYENAQAAVGDVPDAFVSEIDYSGKTNGFTRSTLGGTVGRYSSFTVSDREGNIGLPYVSSKDPRTDTATGTSAGAGPYAHYAAKKYSDAKGESPIVLANGIEARLIEAEAALLRDGATEMFRILNNLRTSCTVGNPCSTPAPAGGGGVAGLPPLDPSDNPTLSSQVDRLFEERAYWMFLTGHRNGDLRRLIRQYHRSSETVYPSGSYPFVTTYGTQYGSDVAIVVPAVERETNSRYTGCINRDA